MLYRESILKALPVLQSTHKDLDKRVTKYSVILKSRCCYLMRFYLVSLASYRCSKIMVNVLRYCSRLFTLQHSPNWAKGTNCIVKFAVYFVWNLLAVRSLCRPKAWLPFPAHLRPTPHNNPTSRISNFLCAAGLAKQNPSTNHHRPTSPCAAPPKRIPSRAYQVAHSFRSTSHNRLHHGELRATVPGRPDRVAARSWSDLGPFDHHRDYPQWRPIRSLLERRQAWADGRLDCRLQGRSRWTWWKAAVQPQFSW